MSHSINKSSSSRYSWKLLLPAGLVVLAVAVAVLELTNTTHFLHKQQAVSGTIPSKSSPQAIEKPKDVANEPEKTSQQPSSVSTSEKSNPISGIANGPLVAPYGTFVSNHKPSLSGSGSPSTQESVCTTTPGASCYITFTNGDVKKTLEAKVVDGTGSVYWQWDVKQAGFSEGSWSITATATSGSESKSTSDDLKLEVKP